MHQHRSEAVASHTRSDTSPASRHARARRGSRIRRGEGRFILTVLVPAVLYYLIFRYYPVGRTLVLSFTDAKLLQRDYNFVGLGNFTALFADPVTLKIVWNTTYYAVVTTIATTLLALVLAFLFEPVQRGGGLLRLLYFLPMATSAIAIATMWSWLYQPRFGLFNQMLSMLGVRPVPWLNSPVWAMPSLIIMSVWGGIGYSMLILYAGLKNIPHEYIEAGRLDGASLLQVVWFIKLPLMARVITFSLITGIIGGFQVFQLVYLMTRGGPLNATNVLALQIYDEAFRHLQIGVAASIAIVLFLIVSLLTVLQFRLQPSSKEN